MKNRTNERLDEINHTTLIMGVDIAKEMHLARFVDYRGREISKAVKIKNDRKGFEGIVTKIEETINLKKTQQAYTNVIIGMEPTGHYWKPLVEYLMQAGYRVVCVNPYHTKKAKELDDNNQTASDYKEALVIARLVKDGRYFNPYIPQEAYGELRVLTNARTSALRRAATIKNILTALMDEYFPELWTVWKYPLKSKAARQVMKKCPLPADILTLGIEGVLSEIKQAVRKTTGIKKAAQLYAAAAVSIGVGTGKESTRQRISMLIGELELLEKNTSAIEQAMAHNLEATGYAEQMLSIKGIGVVTAASFLGEIGDPLRFQNARQIANYAGYNLIEDSSGKSKSGTCISKRGRSQLRSLLYKMAFVMVAQNPEMKTLHHYLTTRGKNPLKKKQSLVVISKKIITVIHSLIKKRAMYEPTLVMGKVRREMMNAA